MKDLELATFAGGCFWCTEAIFKSLKGVEKVTPGYSGGESINPTYEEVSSGTTNHAEAIQISYDPKIISYANLVYPPSQKTMNVSSWMNAKEFSLRRILLHWCVRRRYRRRKPGELHIFFRVHDPTTPDRQGPDMGPQYRSIIFYHNKLQQRQAEEEKAKAQKIYNAPIVTEIKPFEKFYEAENYHSNYYVKNPDKLYCKLVISPKLKKMQEKFSKFVK